MPREGGSKALVGGGGSYIYGATKGGHLPGGMPREGGSKALVGGGGSLIALALAMSSSFARSSSDVCYGRRYRWEEGGSC